jgi:hypothetical protein
MQRRGWGVLFAAVGLLSFEARAAGEVLTKAFIQKTHPALSAADFEKKWAASLASPILFIRAYPAAFHRALATTHDPAPAGGEALCLGDAHPGNFGFLSLEGKTRFAYNDLDDSGYCPVGYDALRYFTALWMFFGDEALVRDIVERYVDVVKDAARASGVPSSLLPKWNKVREKGLSEHVRGGKLVGDELVPASAAEKSAITKLFAREPRLRGVRIVDIASVAREMGGSGGLRRYWVLALREGAATILELKQAVTPGVEWGVASKKLPFASRLGPLKAAFWGTRSDADYFYVALDRTYFLVRDRFTKKSLKVEELSGKTRKDVLQAQASVMGLLHARAWGATKKDALRAWLLTHAAALARSWSDAYKSGRR